MISFINEATIFLNISYSRTIPLFEVTISCLRHHCWIDFTSIEESRHPIYPHRLSSSFFFNSVPKSPLLTLHALAALWKLINGRIVLELLASFFIQTHTFLSSIFVWVADTSSLILFHVKFCSSITWSVQPATTGSQYSIVVEESPRAFIFIRTSSFTIFLVLTPATLTNKPPRATAIPSSTEVLPEPLSPISRFNPGFKLISNFSIAL